MANVTKQKLVNIEEFSKILTNYEPDNTSLQIFSSVPQVILVGPTAAGRNTLINILENTERYKMVVSDTTRKPRLNNGNLEKNGESYWHISEEEFLKGLEEGRYIEAAIIHKQQVSGARIEEFQKALDEGKIAISEVQPDGALRYIRFNPDILAVFLLPPNFETWLERLNGRGKIEESEIRRRLESAAEEISHALSVDFYQFVINNEIHEAAQAVDELANGREPDDAKQELGRNHAEQLAIEVELYLKGN